MWNRTRHPLGRLPLLEGASNAVVERLASFMTSISLPAGEVLVREGAHNRQFMLIENGSVRVDRAGEKIALLGPGDFVGEISLLGDGTATATVTTETPVTLFVSTAAEFRALVESTVGPTITATAAERVTA